MPSCASGRPLRAFAPRPLPFAILPFQPTRAHRLDLAVPAPNPGGRLTRERTRAIRPLRRDPKRSPHLSAPYQAWSAIAPRGPLPYPSATPTPPEIRLLLGVPVTTPERTIVDSLQAGTQPEQIEFAYTKRSSEGSQHPAGFAPPPQSVPLACGASSNTPLLEATRDRSLRHGCTGTA